MYLVCNSIGFTETRRNITMHSRSSIFSASSSVSSLTIFPFPNTTNPRNGLSRKPIFFSYPRTPHNTVLRAQLPDQMAELVHNKVLVAAGVSAAIGQLSKPFTSVILYGKDFDLKSIIQAGGFPSTHSSAVVAAATCLGLERGFSDSVFGITVVYAGLIMYDAQGVRREVGIQARTLNKVLKSTTLPDSIIPSQDIDSQLGTSSSLNYLSAQQKSNTLLVSKSEKTKTQAENVGRSLNGSVLPLKEAIGHTEVEVVAGALLGFLVSLAVNTFV